MAINITSDTVVKLVVRNGIDSDRKNVILSTGELGYTTDTQRLFVGDGSNAGGKVVGNLFLGAVNPISIYSSQAQIGDLIYSTGDNNLYSYTLSGWYQLSPYFDSTMVKNGVTWGVNPSLLATGSTDLSILRNLSGSWNYAVSALSSTPGNSVLANTSSVTGPVSSLVINQNQFLGRTTAGTLTAVSLSALSGLSVTTTGNSFVIDGSQLQNSISTLTTNLSVVSGDQDAVGTTFYRESTFVYSANTWNTYQSQNGLVNQWQYIFADWTKTPLKLTVGPFNRPRTIHVSARVHARLSDNPTSAWFRLGLFNSDMSPINDTSVTASSAISALDVVSVEGIGYYSFCAAPTLDAIYTLPANTTATFGLQSYLYVNRGGNGTSRNSFIEINGWQTGNYNPTVGSIKVSQGGPRNLIRVGKFNDTTFSQISATNSSAASGQFIQTGSANPGALTNDDLFCIKNTSFIRAVIL